MESSLKRPQMFHFRCQQFAINMEYFRVPATAFQRDLDGTAPMILHYGEIIKVLKKTY